MIPATQLFGNPFSVLPWIFATTMNRIEIRVNSRQFFSLLTLLLTNYKLTRRTLVHQLALDYS